MKTLRRLWYLPTDATEVWLSIISIASGLWLLIPFKTISVPFNAFTKAGFSIEIIVALWLIALGSVRLHAVVMGYRRRRGLCAAAAFSTWIFLLYVSLQIDYRALVTVMYFIPSLMSVWAFLRSSLRPCWRECQGAK